MENYKNKEHNWFISSGEGWWELNPLEENFLHHWFCRPGRTPALHPSIKILNKYFRKVK